jgi:hypothetical protein
MGTTLALTIFLFVQRLIETELLLTKETAKLDSAHAEIKDLKYAPEGTGALLLSLLFFMLFVALPSVSARERCARATRFAQNSVVTIKALIAMKTDAERETAAYSLLAGELAAAQVGCRVKCV